MMGAGAVLLLVVVGLVVMAVAIAAGVIFLVAVWRGMRAHESIAQAIRELARTQYMTGQR